MDNLFDILDNDVNLGYDEVIIKNLEKTKYTYHGKFKTITDEIKRRTKKLNIWLWIVGAIFTLVILIGLLNIANTDKIELVLLIIYAIISRKMFNLKIREAKWKSYFMEEFLKQKDWEAICKDEVLEKYYRFEDLGSPEAEKYAEKYKIIGLYRSSHPKK